MEDAQKRIIGSQENLDHLYAEKQIIEENLLIQIENDFGMQRMMFLEFIEKYILTIFGAFLYSNREFSYYR